jgi:hypothetical protein
MMPVPLSYYSPLVGGLPGAARLGMEPTYYWDGLTPPALAWLNERTPEGRSVLFQTNPTAWYDLRQTGRLKVPVAGLEPTAGVPAWYVVQNRTGMLDGVARELIARMGERCVLEAKLGVPLVWAFPYEAYLEARARGAGP